LEQNPDYCFPKTPVLVDAMKAKAEDNEGGWLSMFCFRPMYDAIYSSLDEQSLADVINDIGALDLIAIVFPMETGINFIRFELYTKGKFVLPCHLCRHAAVRTKES
jgi:hypothetical protein